MLTVNLVMMVMEGSVPTTFWIVATISTVVPQALGYKHRSEGWMPPAVSA